MNAKKILALLLAMAMVLFLAACGAKEEAPKIEGDNCCVMAMNGTFIKENPVHAKKIVQCVQKAHCWMRENGADATQFLMDKGWNGGDFEMNVLLNNSLQFGVSDACTEASLRSITENYVRLGLITNMSDVDEIMNLVWNPVLD